MSGESLPSTLGRYEIRSIIGRGMMGVVYEAVDPALGRTVALKTIQLSFGITEHERRVFEERFLTEARLAAGLSHPNIVVVHDVGWDAETGTPFMALEYLKGNTLGDRLEEGQPLDWREALRITGRVGEALHVAHQQGVVHRDVKPANIMLLPSGEPKIMDFGIAKAPASQLTAAGDVFGTPTYMSPEQATGVSVDGRSDIFSLGSILYQMLTAQRAFDAPNVPAILARVTHEAPLSPLQLVPSLPAAVERLLARAMAKDPARRYADGQELAEDVDDLLADRPLRERPGLATELSGSGSPHALSAARSDASGASPHTLAHTATSSISEGHARAGSPGPRFGVSDSGSALSGATPATAGAPPARRSPLAPGLALAGFALVAATSGFLALSLMTTGEAAGRSEPTPVPVAGLAESADPADPAETSPPPATLEGQADPGPGATLPPTARASETADGDASGVSHPLPEGSDRTASAATAPPATAQAAPATTPRPGPAPARILLRVEHSLKRGELRLSAPDGSLVFRHRLRGEEEKKLGVFTTHKGALERTIEVPTGTYFVRVEAIEDEDKRKAGLLRGSFASGQTRVLEVKVHGNMELRWR